MRVSLRRLLTMATVLVLFAAACGDDSEPDDATAESTDQSTTTTGDADSTTTTEAASTTTEGVDGSTTTTEATSTTGATGTGPFFDGSLVNADGLRVEWDLDGDAKQVCFAAALSHPDPAIAETVGDGVDSCLDDPASSLDDALTVSVGTVDGDGAYGYVWGLVDPVVLTLTVEFVDGSQEVLDVVDGPDGLRLFAQVFDTNAIPGVISIDAVSGEQIEDSEPIRDFLRSGPTYPEVEPPATSAPEYPVAGG